MVTIPRISRLAIPRARSLHRLAALAVIALGCGDSLVDPGHSQPPQLLFIRASGTGDWGNQKKDIYRMNADGTGLENLTNLPASYGALSLSPDGRKVAFYSDRDGCYRIWTMSVDGTDLKTVTPGQFFDVRCNYTPRWSPDGSQIAFTTSREGAWSVYVMNSDGSNPRNVSGPYDRVGFGTWPVGWSPDGHLIFEHFGEHGVQAYVVNLTAHERGPLFGRTGDRSPAWSRDGSKVAFIRDIDGRSSLWVSDRSILRRLTNHAGDDELGVGVLGNQLSPWSPDGNYIAFLNVVDFKVALDVVRADGSGHRRLTGYANAGDITVDGWSADGRIIYTSAEAGSSDVYLVNPDGTGRVNLTNNSATHDRYALWLPRR